MKRGTIKLTGFDLQYLEDRAVRLIKAGHEVIKPIYMRGFWHLYDYAIILSDEPKRRATNEYDDDR